MLKRLAKKQLGRLKKGKKRVYKGWKGSAKKVSFSSSPPELKT
jgi:hypothetical protein